MPVFTRNDTSLFFIHIPKTGGSTIRTVAKHFGWEESFSIRKKKLKDIQYYKASPQHIHADVLKQVFNFDVFDQIFTLVREPFSRLKSEYYWQQSRGLTTKGVSEWIDRTFEQYTSDPYIFDNHIRPQSEFIPDHNNTQIFKLEENGVQKAKSLLQENKADLTPLERWKFSVSGLLDSNRREKHSSPNQEVEKAFNAHHKEIVAFYASDYTAFKYRPNIKDTSPAGAES